MQRLEEASGQGYIRTSTAWELLAAFHEQVEDDYVFGQVDVMEPGDQITDTDRGLALSHALEERQRSDAEARGMTNVLPHEMLVTYSDVSAILVEALGDEPSDYTAGGYGFTSDGRHDSNISTLKEQVA